MNDRPRAPLGALALLALVVGDLTGLVNTADVVNAGVGAFQGYCNVAHCDMIAGVIPLPTPSAAKPPRKPRVASPPPRPPAAAAPSGPAPAGIPQLYSNLYHQAGNAAQNETWCTSGGDCYQAWAILAGIGAAESGHGQSQQRGVHSGVNFAGCCAGPMQFNVRNGPPSTWDTWGQGNVYDPHDAIPAAARKLRGNGALRDLDGALLRYNALWSYVNGVKAQARAYEQGA